MLLRYELSIMPLASVQRFYRGRFQLEAGLGASITGRNPSYSRCKQHSPICKKTEKEILHRSEGLLFARLGCPLRHHSYNRKRGQCALAVDGLVRWDMLPLMKRKISSKTRAVEKEKGSSTEGEGHEERCGGAGHGDGEQQEGGEGGPSCCLYLKKTVENGEVVEHSGSVMILGDVKPRGHVLADGDIVVLGRLQGHVHAGRAGAAKSKVFATAMEASEIRICDSALFCPEDDKTCSAKMAVLLPDGSVTIHPAVEGTAEEETTVEERVKQNAGLSRGISYQKRESMGRGGYCSARTKKFSRVRSQQRGEELGNRRPAQVALVTGIYISVAGIALLGFPKALFGLLFDLQGVTLGWVQVGAILAVVFGVYYIGTAIGDMRGMNGAEAFYLSTVIGRTFLFFSFFGLVVAGAVPGPLLLVGVVNLAGAMLMLNALFRSPMHKKSA